MPGQRDVRLVAGAVGLSEDLELSGTAYGLLFAPWMIGMALAGGGLLVVAAGGRVTIALAGAMPVLAALAGLALEAAAPRRISPAPGEELARPAT